MAQFFVIHPENPQVRLIKAAVQILQNGGVIVYPTDSCYALGCILGNKEAMERIIAIRRLDRQHNMTLVCSDLSELSKYARVENSQFRLLKAATPGSYTFVLRATKEVPRRTLHTKRDTIGLRVPDHKVTLALLEVLGAPILSCTLMLPEEGDPLANPYEIRDRLEHNVDLIIDSGWCSSNPTTVLDLTNGVEILRRGKGELAPLGLE